MYRENKSLNQIIVDESLFMHGSYMHKVIVKTFALANPQAQAAFDDENDPHDLQNHNEYSEFPTKIRIRFQEIFFEEK